MVAGGFGLNSVNALRDLRVLLLDEVVELCFAGGCETALCCGVESGLHELCFVSVRELVVGRVVETDRTGFSVVFEDVDAALFQRIVTDRDNALNVCVVLGDSDH